MSKVSTKDLIDHRLAREHGTIFKQAPEAVALVYPSPYHVGMSSLGFQTIYRTINDTPGRAAERAFMPDEASNAASETLVTYETRRPVGDFPVIGLSVAYELELAGVISVLQSAGLQPLAEERAGNDPFVLGGGPLTFSNPVPLGPFCDAILLGEADETVHQALSIIFDAKSKEHAKQLLAERIPSAFVPAVHGEQAPPIAQAADDTLPARAQIITSETELRDMFLIEAERGCSRGCRYCVMRRTTNGGMRLVAKDRLLGLIPPAATRVGLVGAAVSDHPDICAIVEELADGGRQVGLSSLRPNRITDRFCAALRKGGYRTLTTAADGASQRLRQAMERGAKEDHLKGAAELARAHGFERMKLYMIVGLPDETDADIDELIALATTLSQRIPLALAVGPFVAKRNTPLDRAPFAGIDVVEGRLRRLRAGLKGRVDLRSTSARWAYVEHVLAQGGFAEGHAVLAAVNAGGRHRHYRDAIAALPPAPHRRAMAANR